MEKFFDDVFFPYILKNNIKTVVNLGDTFDQRTSVNVNTLSRARKMFFDKLEKNNIDYHTIIGNHDCPFKNTNEPNSVSEVFPNYKVYSSCQHVYFDDMPILFVPWINEENKNETIKTIQNSKAKVCFGHLELNGFKLTSTGSIKNDAENITDFTRFDVLLSGHYHFRSSRGNIHYIGNPSVNNWDDHGGDHGFAIFDTKTNKIEYINNPYSIFHEIIYSKKIKNIEKYKNSYIKLIKSVDINEADFEEFKKKLEDQGVIELQVIENVIDLNVSTEIQKSVSTLSVIKQYTENITDENINKEQLFNKLNEIYTEALEYDS